MSRREICIDIGCGSGRSYMFNPSCPLHFETVLIDVEYPSSDIARFVSSRGSLHFVVASVEMLPLRSSCVDRGYAVHVLEHVTDLRRALLQIWRVMKPGALLHVVFPTLLSVDIDADPSHRQRMTFLRFAKIARSCGFSVILPVRAGSKLPRIVRRLLSIFMNMVVDHLSLVLRTEKRES